MVGLRRLGPSPLPSCTDPSLPLPSTSPFQPSECVTQEGPAPGHFIISVMVETVALTPLGLQADWSEGPPPTFPAPQLLRPGEPHGKAGQPGRLGKQPRASSLPSQREKAGQRPARQSAVRRIRIRVQSQDPTTLTKWALWSKALSLPPLQNEGERLHAVGPQLSATLRRHRTSPPLGLLHSTLPTGDSGHLLGNRAPQQLPPASHPGPQGEASF